MRKRLTTLNQINLLIVISLIAFCVPVLADGSPFNIKGKVFEKGTRTPLAGANVFIVDHDDLYAVANSDGDFEISAPEPGAYAIAAVAMDYEKSFPTTVIVGMGGTETNSVELIIYLMPVTLEPVVIVGERNEDRVSKTVISGRELEQVAGSGGDPLKAIQSLPGVTSGHDASSEPAIRGARPGDNVYYIDDIEVSYLYHLGGIISVIPPDLVSDFNLFASAFGPQFDDVVGAVLDVGLRNPRTDRFGGKVNIGILASELLFEGPVNKDQSFFFSARRSYFDLIIDHIEDEKSGVTVQVPNYYDYTGKYVWEINTDNRLKLYFNGAGDEIRLNISEDGEVAKNEPVFVGDSYADTTYDNQTVVWDSRLATNNNNKVMLGHRITSATSKTGTAFELDTDWEETFIRDAFRYQGIKQHDVLVGAGYHKYNIDINADGVNPLCTDFNPDNCDDVTGAQRSSFHDTLDVNFWNGYVKDRWRLIENVTWITGLRYTHEDYLKSDFMEPRLGLEWDVNSKLLFTMGWGKHHQFPEGRYVLEGFGNPDVDHIESDHYVLGFEAQLNKTWLVKTDLYYKSFDKFIVADEEQNFVNGASGESYGMELLIKKNPTDNLSGWLSLTLSESERRIDATGESFPFDYDQPVIASLITNYRFTPKLHLGAKWHYHSGTPYTPIIGSTKDGDRSIPTRGALNSERLPDYHRLDVRLDYDWIYNTWKLQTYFEIINLYNRCNVAGYDYDVDYNLNSKEEVCQLPLIPSFGIQAEF